MRKRCSECNGTKTLMKLGGIRGVCTKCDGKGYVEVKDEKPERTIKEAFTDIQDSTIETTLKKVLKTKSKSVTKRVTAQKKKKKVKRKG